MVIECAQINGYKIKADQPVAENKINEFDGAFLTHTSGNIVPIKSINGFSFASIPPALKELMNDYDQCLDSGALR